MTGKSKGAVPHPTVQSHAGQHTPTEGEKAALRTQLGLSSTSTAQCVSEQAGASQLLHPPP